MDKIYVGIASIPERERNLKTVVEGFYDKVDKIYVYLNNYKGIPDFLKKNKIECFLGDNSTGDAGKFYKVSESNGYYFACDDDLIYPESYIEYLINKIEEYNRGSIVGIHGVNMLGKIETYYKSRNVFHFMQELKNDKFVHILGTGTIAFHTDTIQIKYDDFKHPNMADIWLGKLAQEQNVNMVCLGRDSNYLGQQKIGKNIFSTHKNNDLKQTEVVKSIDWQIKSPLMSSQIGGVKIIHNNDYLGKYYKKSEEFYENKLLSLFKIKNNSVILDIGANIGNHTIYRGKEGHTVYAFEPVKKTYNILKRNLEINNLKNCHAINVGLSDNHGKMGYINIEHNCGANSLSGSGNILVYRLDDIEIKQEIDVIKIDVEGMENQVIFGGLGIINKYKPDIILESFDKNCRGIKILKMLGYDIHKSLENNYLLKCI